MRYSVDLPDAGSWDVVVCGGGPAGTAAALGAARGGRRTLLVESEAQLGGMATSGLVSHWLGGRTPAGDWVVGGIFRELAERAADRGMALLPVAGDDPYPPWGWARGLAHGVPLDPFALALLYDEVMAEAGVDVLLKTDVVDAVVEDGRIGRLVLHNKSGLQAVGAAAVVDATGDADVAARSGCAVRLGREEDGLMAPATLEMHVDRVDTAALSAYIHEHDAFRFLDEIREWRAAGDWPFDWDRFISVQLTEPDTYMVNAPRITGVDGTDGRSLSDGLVRGRTQVYRLLDIMRRRIPGCGAARVKAVAGRLGVRETRRIVGGSVLTVDEVCAGAAFGDTIGFSSYGWDLPDPLRPSHQPLHEAGLAKPPVAPIPYRIMVPRPVANLVCPGRAVSCERPVLGPLRVMAPCMAMGEAAGVAARQVAGGGTSFADVDIAALRDALRDGQAIVDRETP